MSEQVRKNAIYLDNSDSSDSRLRQKKVQSTTSKKDSGGLAGEDDSV